MDQDINQYHETVSTAIDSPITIKILRRLNEEGLLSREAYKEAVTYLNAGNEWAAWAYGLMLSMGCMLFLSGVVFFFAYNWSKVPWFARLGGIQALMCIFAFVAIVTGLDRVAGKLCSLCAALMAGMFLSVFAQKYQTGADSYELFRCWALLILPWVLLTRYEPLWAMWLMIADAGIYFYVKQVFTAGTGGHIEQACVAIAGFDIVSLLTLEYFRAQGVVWLGSRWFRIMLVVFVLAALFIPSVEMVINIGTYHEDDIYMYIAVFAFVTFLAVAYMYYGRVVHDIGTIGICALFASSFVVFAAGRAAVKANDIMTAILEISIIVLVVFTSAALWLQRVSMWMRNANDGKPKA